MGHFMVMMGFFKSTQNQVLAWEITTDCCCLVAVTSTQIIKS